jgi:hypothetical protein
MSAGGQEGTILSDELSAVGPGERDSPGEVIVRFIFRGLVTRLAFLGRGRG